MILLPINEYTSNKELNEKLVISQTNHAILAYDRPCKEKSGLGRIDTANVWSRQNVHKMCIGKTVNNSEK